ncbi:MAG: cysteine desufuration protein SufE [Naasia sp.]|jgi:cysteine desulfuration protein SufE|uniref:SufE family protein n=1 Tax=Naasia sp. TaxID=2546198 RepID=UPI0026312CCD|nr:SufE family protein [Naasia sp.]MCU1571176.1 cysteine desufuration protein SufE [Naasia sp.]
MSAALPPALEEIRDEFLALGQKDRLLLLLEFANELPELPARLQGHEDLLERVVECQSPVFLTTEVEDGTVRLHATAPRESPTTRGFASILVQGLSGLSPDDLLAVPDDFPQMLGLTEAVSPLRLRGMSGMLARTKRQVAQRLAAAGA